MISHTTEYALRAVVYLAAQPSQEPASAREIAKGIRVPVGYLQKVLRMLVKNGILHAQRGVHGGFTLAKVPSAISVLDVQRATDAPLQRIERCPLGIPGHTRLCSLHRLLDQEIARSERIFAATSLEDLMDQNGGARPLCGLIRGERTPLSIEESAPSAPESSGAASRPAGDSEPQEADPNEPGVDRDH